MDSQLVVPHSPSGPQPPALILLGQGSAARGGSLSSSPPASATEIRRGLGRLDKRDAILGGHLGKPVVIFDTSAINELKPEGARLMIAAVASDFHFRLTGLNVGEIVATQKATERALLLDRCAELLASGECIWPPQEILRLLISAHFKNPSRFEWARVNVRAEKYERAVVRRAFPENVSAKQKQEQKTTQRAFERWWAGLRLELDAVFAKDSRDRPPNFPSAVAMLRVDGGLLWTFAQTLYEGVTESRPHETVIRAFMDTCPPFRAAVYGLMAMFWYDRCVRVPGTEPSFGARRNDMMMSVYLPYCGCFVSAEKHQVQERCLREVALAAGVGCEVLSYETFCAGFSD
jgi:hypothetical protein